MKNLTIITLSYNTAELTVQALRSVQECLALTPEVSYEIIVVDNGSTDGSVREIKKAKIKNLVLIDHGKNIGFGAANNLAAKHARGKYLLLLNSDTIVTNINFARLFEIFEKRPHVGVLTVKLILSNGLIDPASHRGFPTLWRSFSYFAKLERVTMSVPILNRIFGGYHLTHLDTETEHEIDSPSGAFFLTTKEIYDKVGGFDEDFFMYGEDLDLAFRIKRAGYKVWYYPYYSIIHLKGQSGRKSISEKKKRQTTVQFYDAMKIFYKKHYEKRYPGFVNTLVYRILESKSS